MSKREMIILAAMAAVIAVISAALLLRPDVPPEVVVHRITGDGAKRDLVAPSWSADKKRVLNFLNRLLGQ